MLLECDGVSMAIPSPAQGLPALVYYKPPLVMAGQNDAEMQRFSALFRVIKPIPLVDRTGEVRFPLHLKPLFPMPPLRTETRSFEDIANTRASEIMARAEALDCDIYVMWSGGIDSTLILVTFLKTATPAQLQRIVVLLSEDSISEAPDFYRQFICGKLRMESAQLFPYLLGTRHLFVSGEHADQLFGSDIIGKLMTRAGNAIIHKPYSRDVMRTQFSGKDARPEDVETCLDLFEFLASKAPIPIETNFHFLWWLNFNLKWQSVFLRTLSYLAPRNISGMNADYVRERYLPFFVTEDFQQWSLNNPDKRIKDSWNTYKWVAKDIIFAFTGDEGYRRYKVKRGSLFFIILRKFSWNFMDENFKLMQQIDVNAYRQPAFEPWRKG